MKTHRHVKLLCVSFALLLIACEEKQNRYQIVTRGAVIMKTDTKTGKSWKWQPIWTVAENGGPSRNRSDKRYDQSLRFNRWQIQPGFE
jgi:hypothetical protein